MPGLRPYPPCRARCGWTVSPTPLPKLPGHGLQEAVGLGKEMIHFRAFGFCLIPYEVQIHKPIYILTTKIIMNWIYSTTSPTSRGLLCSHQRERRWALGADMSAVYSATWSRHWCSLGHPECWLPLAPLPHGPQPCLWISVVSFTVENTGPLSQRFWFSSSRVRPGTGIFFKLPR